MRLAAAPVRNRTPRSMRISGTRLARIRRARLRSSPELAPHEMLDHLHPLRAVVEAGHRGEVLAAVLVERLGVADAISSSVSRQSAEKPGVITAMPLHPRSRRARRCVLGVGLEPLGLAEARLEGDAEPVLRPAEPLAQQPRRLLALAMIGVALVEIVPRQAVEEAITTSGSKSSAGECRPRATCASASI